MVQNKTFSAKALQTFVAVMFAVITCFGFMTTPTAEAASGHRRPQPGGRASEGPV